jgi:hypothetical protein
MQGDGRVPGAPEAVDGLAHLPNRTSLERETADGDDRLVAVVDRAETAPSVKLQRAFRCSENRDPPIPFSREVDEPVEQGAERSGRPDRVARDDCHAADDPVREEGSLVLAEEVRLVRPQHEGCKRVRTPITHEAAGDLALPSLLPQPVAPGGKPHVN